LPQQCRRDIDFRDCSAALPRLHWDLRRSGYSAKCTDGSFMSPFSRRPAYRVMCVVILRIMIREFSFFSYRALSVPFPVCLSAGARVFKTTDSFRTTAQYFMAFPAISETGSFPAAHGPD